MADFDKTPETWGGGGDDMDDSPQSLPTIYKILALCQH